MWQAVARHDRARFELFFYSRRARSATSGRSDSRASRRASTSSAALDDATAADRIAADDLDLLVDLSTHTKGSRPGILAAKPARVQLTHVASAGAVGLSQIDWKLTDRHCDLPESQEFMIERLIAMDGCVYPYRHVAPARDASVSSRVARHCRRRDRHRRVRQSPQAVAPLPSLVARRAGARPESVARLLAGQSRDARELRAHRESCRHRREPASSSCRRAATTRRTRRAIASSTSCSTRCPSAGSTARSRRST